LQVKPKKPDTIQKIQSFFGKSDNSNDKDSAKESSATSSVIGPGKASKLKKMFEEKPRVMRTR
jgi:hypothetical protein